MDYWLRILDPFSFEMGMIYQRVPLELKKFFEIYLTYFFISSNTQSFETFKCFL
jgi:hypothetical protein